MKKLLIQCVLVGIGLASSGAGCGSQNSDPQPAASALPTTLNSFDTYMVGTWEFENANSTFKKDGKSNGLTKSATYSYSYVFNKDHTFSFTGAVSGPTGINVTTDSGKWATSTTAGSKPKGSFNFPTVLPNSATQPTLPFSFVLTPQSTSSQQICYIIYMDKTDNSMAFDWISSDGGLETYEIWKRIK